LSPHCPDDVPSFGPQQNMNVVLGYPEATGLDQVALFP
jgi:hypothetical protein